MRGSFKNLTLALASGAVLAVVLTQSSLAFIDLASQYLSNTSFDSLIFLGAAFLISFFLMVIAGWVTGAKSFINPLAVFLTYTVLESFFRMARLKRVPALESFLMIWRVAELYLMLLAAFSGIFLGYIVGAKARSEEHRVRLYVFSAFFALILISAALIHGIETFNPLSASRGVL